MEEALQYNNNLGYLQQELEKKTRSEEILNNKLAEMTKEMNQFTYIVSHDLQAPLRMVTGFLELLEKKHGDKLDLSARQYIDFAVRGASKMKDLVFDLLEYSRLSSVNRDVAEVDLNEIVKEVKHKFLPVIEESGALITAGQLPVIKADQKQMVQLFGHLLDNSLKFRTAAVPEITITLKNENDHWVVAVKDNGPGIETAFLEKIFIVFRRLYSDETKYKGTGIGLAICRKIVELHDGRIWAESTLNKGSTFYFTLPDQSV